MKLISIMNVKHQKCTSQFFIWKARLPVQERFGFSDDLVFGVLIGWKVFFYLTSVSKRNLFIMIIFSLFREDNRISGSCFIVGGRWSAISTVYFWIRFDLSSYLPDADYLMIFYLFSTTEKSPTCLFSTILRTSSLHCLLEQIQLTLLSFDCIKAAE